MAADQMDSALDFIRVLNREFPRDPEVLYLAVHLFSDLSVRASQQLLFTSPGAYQVHELNAEALETQGRWKEAAMEYREVLKKNPLLPGIHYRLGRLLLSQPRTTTSRDEARREFEEELKLNPKNPGAEYVLGELAREDEQWPAAIEHFSHAAKLDAGFGDAFIGLGRSLISGGRPAEAIAPLEIAEKLLPDNPAAHFHLATAYRLTGRKPDADREFALHQQTSEKMRQMKEQIHAGVTGPQNPLGPQKDEP
jgi:tetratricopeptide (TPR) repeat protein